MHLFNFHKLVISFANFNQIFFRGKVMKHLRQFCAITVLSFALAASAFADGETPGGRSISEPAPREQTMLPPTAGETPGGRPTTEEMSYGEVTSVASVQSALLNALQTLMSLF